MIKLFGFILFLSVVSSPAQAALVLVKHTEPVLCQDEAFKLIQEALGVESMQQFLQNRQGYQGRNMRGNYYEVRDTQEGKLVRFEMSLLSSSDPRIVEKHFHVEMNFYSVSGDCVENKFAQSPEENK